MTEPRFILKVEGGIESERERKIYMHKYRERSSGVLKKKTRVGSALGQVCRRSGGRLLCRTKRSLGIVNSRPFQNKLHLDLARFWRLPKELC